MDSPSTAGTLLPGLADRYRIERVLGAGGMATVYLAEDVRHRRQVAIKVLHPELSAVLGPERFLKEIELTANLQHPHILPLFDSGSAEGLLYYVMPLVDGVTLRTRLERERQLPVAEALRVAQEVADALAYAHARGVVHRDIKPENILLHGGHALVADFGIALAVEHAGAHRITQTGLSLGTPQYMAPEQAMGERSVDARADVYALGAVLYEMLAGEPPFTGPNAQAIVAKLLTTGAVPLASLRPSVPAHVGDAVMTALEKLPADRFASADEFGRALGGAAESRSTRAPTAAAADLGARERSPSRVWATRGGVLAAALLVGGAAGWIVASGSSTPAAPIRFVVQTDSVLPVDLCCGFQLAVAPGEQRIYFVGSSQGTSHIYVRDLNEVTPRVVAGTAEAMEVILSPDGAWLAFRVPARSTATVEYDFELRKVPVGGGSATVVAGMAGWPYGGTWTDDDAIVLAAESKPLRQVAAAGGELRIIPGTEAARAPRYIREANAIAFARATPGGGLIHLADLKTGEVVELGEGMASTSAPGGYLIVARSTLLAAYPFDPRTRRFTGAPMPLVNDLSRPIDYAVGDGGMLVYASGVAGGIIVKAELGGATEVLPLPITATHFDSPRYSPDGRFLAVAAGRSPGHELLVADVARGTAVRMTFGGDTEFADWTPDGRSLVYVKDDSLLAIQPADRSAPERVLYSGGAVRIARVSVGGGWIAFATHPAGAPRLSDIHLMPLEAAGAAARPHLATLFSERSPALSPDGRWLAYVSDESGRDEVYVTAVPTAGAREPISRSGGREPVWARDGRTLYHRGFDGEIIANSVVTTPELRVTGTTPLLQPNSETASQGADYDVHPDGRSFIVVRSRAAEVRLTVATGALAGVKKQ